MCERKVQPEIQSCSHLRRGIPLWPTLTSSVQEQTIPIGRIFLSKNEENTLYNLTRCTICARTHTRSCKSAPVIGSCISKILFSFLRTSCAVAWRDLGADGAPLRGAITTTFRGRPVRRAIVWLVQRDGSKVATKLSAHIDDIDYLCEIIQSSTWFAKGTTESHREVHIHLTGLPYKWVFGPGNAH